MKSRKKVRIACIIAAAVIIIGIAVYVAVPLINNAMNPSLAAINALKNARQEFSQSAAANIDSMINSAADDTIRDYTGSLTLESLSYGSHNLLDYINVDTFGYSYGADLSNNKVSGSLYADLGDNVSDTASDTASVNFYMDDKSLYFKLPKLSAYNYKLNYSDAQGLLLKLPNETTLDGTTLDGTTLDGTTLDGTTLDGTTLDGTLSDGTNEINSKFNIGSTYLNKCFGLYEKFINLFKDIDSEDVSSYSAMSASFLEDIGVGIDKAIEQFTYSSAEKVGYSSEYTGYSSKTTHFTVTVTKEALLEGADAAIEAIYDDNMIASYRTLASSYYKLSREKLKEAVRSELEDFEDFDMDIWVSGKRVIAYSISENISGDKLSTSESIYGGILSTSESASGDTLSASNSISGSALSTLDSISDNTLEGKATVFAESAQSGVISFFMHEVSYGEAEFSYSAKRMDDGSYEFALQSKSDSVSLALRGTTDVTVDGQSTGSAEDNASGSQLAGSTGGAAGSQSAGSSGSGLAFDASDFTNALDVTQLTDSQYQSILKQMLENRSILGKILDIDKLSIQEE